MAKKELLVINAPRDAAYVALAHATGYSPLGNRSLDAIVQGAQLYAVLDGPEPVLWYALHVQGCLAWITGAVGRLPHVDLTRSLLPFIEDQARAANAKRIGCSTKRRGLIKKLAAQGYAVSGPCGPDGYSMEKTLQ